MWHFNIDHFDLLKEKISENGIGLNKNGIGRKFPGISHPGIYTSFQMTGNIFPANSFFFKLWGQKGLSLNVNFFFEIIFMMTNPRTNFDSVSPMFWSFHRAREIIPHFCSSNPSCRHFQYFTKFVRNTWGLFVKRLLAAVLQLY